MSLIDGFWSLPPVSGQSYPIIRNNELLPHPFGPIIVPRPGPTLEIAVAAPEIEVMKSKPLRDNNVVIIKKYLTLIVT